MPTTARVFFRLDCHHCGEPILRVAAVAVNTPVVATNGGVLYGVCGDCDRVTEVLHSTDDGEVSWVGQNNL